MTPFTVGMVTFTKEEWHEYQIEVQTTKTALENAIARADRCDVKLSDLVKALERISIRAERDQFQTGAVARGCVQTIRDIADKALAEWRCR